MGAPRRRHKAAAISAFPLRENLARPETSESLASSATAQQIAPSLPDGRRDPRTAGDTAARNRRNRNGEPADRRPPPPSRTAVAAVISREARRDRRGP